MFWTISKKEMNGQIGPQTYLNTGHMSHTYIDHMGLFQLLWIGQSEVDDQNITQILRFLPVNMWGWGWLEMKALLQGTDPWVRREFTKAPNSSQWFYMEDELNTEVTESHTISIHIILLNFL